MYVHANKKINTDEKELTSGTYSTCGKQKGKKKVIRGMQYRTVGSKKKQGRGKLPSRYLLFCTAYKWA